jgi:hypothetical protein
MFRFLTQSKERVGGAKTERADCSPASTGWCARPETWSTSSLRSPIGSVMQEVARRKAKKQEADCAA